MTNPSQVASKCNQPESACGQCHFLSKELLTGKRGWEINKCAHFGQSRCPIVPNIHLMRKIQKKVKSLFPALALKSLKRCVSQMQLMEPHKIDFFLPLMPPTIAFHLCVTTRIKSYTSATSHQTVDPNRGLRFLLVVEPDAQEASANSHCLFKGKAIPGKFVDKSTIKIIHQQGLLDPLGQEPTLQNTDLGTGPSLKIATDTPMDRQLLTLPKTCKVTCIAASVYHEHQLKKLTRSHNHLNGFPLFGCFSIPFTFNTFKIRDLALALRAQSSTAVMLHLVKNHAKTISNNSLITIDSIPILKTTCSS